MDNVKNCLKSKERFGASPAREILGITKPVMGTAQLSTVCICNAKEISINHSKFIKNSDKCNQIHRNLLKLADNIDTMISPLGSSCWLYHTSSHANARCNASTTGRNTEK